MQTVIEKIESRAKQIAAGEMEQVKPGMPASFTAACQSGDCIRQGDLYLIVADCVPGDYVKVKRPNASDRQLVPGNTQGARHCLDSIRGVKMFRPEKWDSESLQGPCIVTSEKRTVTHPTHGHIVIPAGMTVLCRYQREWEKEQQREMRARD